MENDDLKSKTSEKLESELKAIKIIMGFLIGALIFLFAITIYGLITKENKATFIALIAVAFSCSAIFPWQFSSMNKIKSELKFRKNTD